jgi:hypothetical protein
MSATVRVVTVAINADNFQEKRAAQARKINEIKAALVSCGCYTLNRQALALGLCRSTTWNLLTGGHKHRGLTADVINSILSCPELPEPVRFVINDYIQCKLAGEYGHPANAIARFRTRLLHTPRGMTARQQPRPARMAQEAVSTE